MSPQIIDTNVPATANLALDPDAPTELLPCIRNCVNAIEVAILGRIVLDAGDEVFDEYRRNLSLSGQPGQGDKFLKWLHDRRWTFPNDDRVVITKLEDSYEEFPSHPDLEDFDNSDRKFVALANTHIDKPPILEATDSKWWGWATALEEAGITVIFLCEAYIKSKFEKKMEQ